MAKSRKDPKRKKKAQHYTMMVTHAKKSFEKKRIEAFQQMLKENMPKVQQENVVDAPDVDVDVDLDDVMIQPEEVVDVTQEQVEQK